MHAEAAVKVAVVGEIIAAADADDDDVEPSGAEVTGFN